MSKKVILKESSLLLLFEDNRINLQLINGNFYPTDALSKNILVDKYHLERIPEKAFDIWSPRMVRDGYRLAVTGYNPKPTFDSEKEQTVGALVGDKPKLIKNPCFKCKMKGMCDSDECGMKIRK